MSETMTTDPNVNGEPQKSKRPNVVAGREMVFDTREELLAAYDQLQEDCAAADVKHTYGKWTVDVQGRSRYVLARTAHEAIGRAYEERVACERLDPKRKKGGKPMTTDQLMVKIGLLDEESKEQLRAMLAPKKKK